MFPVFRSVSWRYLRRRKERSLLIIASIAIGVGTLVSTRVLNDALESAAHDTMTPLPSADLYAANGKVGVRQAAAQAIRDAKVPGVIAVVPMLFEQVRLPGVGSEKEGRTAILLGGETADLTELKADGQSAFTFRIIDPIAALTRSGVFVSEDVLRERTAQGIAQGEPLTVRYAGTQKRYPIAGAVTMRSDGPAASFGRNLIALDLKLALRQITEPLPLAVLGMAGSMIAEAPVADRITRVDLYLTPGTDPEVTRETVQKIVGDAAKIRTPDQQKKSTDDAISGIRISLTVCSAGALVVGLFLVYNALSVSVAERRHDIGILRSLGATRTQIARLFATEALLLGLVGSLLGIPLGKWLADIAIRLVASELSNVFLSGTVERGALGYFTLSIAVGAGMVTALLAALIPAIQAASDEPADAVRRSPDRHGGWAFRLHVTACALFIGGGFVLILLRKSLPDLVGASLGLMSVLVGFLLAMPFLVKLTALALQPLVRRTFGVAERLAADNLLRAPGRTGVVIGTLAAGVALMFQTAGVGTSNERPIRAWLDQVVQADAFIFWGNLASANSSMTPMNASVMSGVLQSSPAIERVIGLRQMRPEFRGTVICVMGIDALDYQAAITGRGVGVRGIEHFHELPHQNNIVVSENFAELFHVGVGTVITLPTRRGPIDLTIVGIGQDYTWNRGTIFLDRSRYAEIFEDELVDLIHVFFKPGADAPATRRAIESVVAERQLVVEGKPFVREFLAGIIDKMYRFAYMQQLLVALVAGLGVVTALLISVLQRQRELGLLRAVGATRVQILRTVIAEAAWMGMIGTFLGLAVGLPIEWFLLDFVIFEDSGFKFPMLVPWRETLGIGILAVLAATAAGLLPALQAVRMRIPEAIAYE